MDNERVTCIKPSLVNNLSKLSMKQARNVSMRHIKFIDMKSSIIPLTYPWFI